MQPARASTKPKAKRPSKPLYLRCERLIRPETGEEIRGWVALTQWDARAMKDRGYKAGTEVRAEFRRPRNSKFNGLAHAIGALIVDHVEGFEGKDAHEALKKVQGEAGICCEESTIDASPLVELVLAAADQSLGSGARKILEAVLSEFKTLTVKVPESIAFDSMPEERFNKLVLEVCQYIREKFNGVPPEELEQIIATAEEGA